MSGVVGHCGVLHGGGGPPASSHRYWRVLISANNQTGSTGFTEIELRSSPGGADVTVPQASVLGAATASSRINASNDPIRAVDNSNTTGWLSGGGPPQWWRYDFGNADHTGNPTEVVQQIQIRGSWNQPTASPRDFELQWSDDNSTWTTVMTVTGQTGWTGASDARTFNV